MGALVASQKSFNSGEWAPQLYARVDMERYHSGAALLRNFFVDYRGGASSRPGTKYVIQARNSAGPVRLIPFQASFDVAFILEFGEGYVRFHRNGAPVLESTINITGITRGVETIVTAANSYASGDWVYITGINGTTQLNGQYYVLYAVSGANFRIRDLFGNNINSSGFGAWTSGGTAARVYTLTSPYTAAQVAQLKYAQNVNTLILCHPDVAPYSLIYTSPTSWLLGQIQFGTSTGVPTGVLVTTTLSASTINYSYVVTAVDAQGQESNASLAGILANVQDLRTTAGSNRISWNAVSGAVSYNVYKSEVSYGAAVPSGSPHGFIGNTTGVSLDDSNILPDYTLTPPIASLPFVPGASVTSVTITNPGAGTYTATPSVSFAAPAQGVTATGSAVMEVWNMPIFAGGAGFTVGTIYDLGNGVSIQVTSTGPGGSLTGFAVLSRGTFTGTLPSFMTVGGSATLAPLDYAVKGVNIINSGSGYLSPPAVTFSGAATGTAILGPANTGNPTVPGFVQQRLVLAAPPGNPQGLYFSQPGAFYNFDIANPLQDSNGITETLVSGVLNNVKSVVPVTSGLLVISDGLSWLVAGGTQGAGISPLSIVANPQSYIGANDVPPIVINYDVLYVQSMGSGVYDAAYNFSYNVFTGADISLFSSHLFFGYEITEWAWAKEPFKLVYAIRNDGTLLNLTFVKEQEFVAWTHSDTGANDVAGTIEPFQSVATIIENRIGGYSNAVYVVVERTINGNEYKYIECFAERTFPEGVEDAWCVDCGVLYDGAPATTFRGAEFLWGRTVTGLADGEIIAPFVMAYGGAFTLPTAASKVLIGLSFKAQLKTLALDLGEPTIQGKMKSIAGVTVRVAETLGLEIGSDEDNLVAMKDLVRGEVSTMLVGQGPNQIVADLVTGDAKTSIDPTWTVPGQYFIQQANPYPATILGVFPEVVVENAK